MLPSHDPPMLQGCCPKSIRASLRIYFLLGQDWLLYNMDVGPCSVVIDSAGVRPTEKSYNFVKEDLHNMPAISENIMPAIYENIPGDENIRKLATRYILIPRISLDYMAIMESLI